MINPFSDTAEGITKGFIGSVGDIIARFKADPTKVVETQAALEQAAMNLTASVIGAVNATMQSEAKSEHWMQWSWRPTFGFTACAILVNNYILAPYFAKLGVVSIAVPSEVWLMIMAVLGVAAWTRGRDKDQK